MISIETLPAPVNAAEKESRLRHILELIEIHPRHWRQTSWHCGSSHCFGGLAQCVARDVSIYLPTRSGWCLTDINDIGKDCPHVFSTEEDAIRWLGLTASQAADLFDSDNSLEQLRFTVEEIIQNAHAKEKLYKSS